MPPTAHELLERVRQARAECLAIRRRMSGRVRKLREGGASGAEQADLAELAEREAEAELALAELALLDRKPPEAAKAAKR
jgi:hypothetical protein